MGIYLLENEQKWEKGQFWLDLGPNFIHKYSILMCHKILPSVGQHNWWTSGINYLYKVFSFAKQKRMHESEIILNILYTHENVVFLNTLIW